MKLRILAAGLSALTIVSALSGCSSVNTVNYSPKGINSLKTNISNDNQAINNVNPDKNKAAVLSVANNKGAGFSVNIKFNPEQFSLKNNTSGVAGGPAAIVDH